ncbi:MAG: hypothetical protein JO152_16575, partial [Mycobacteriaceae bacterium]|nr:hypothetical protein [Mycobacteriaceae bacterium]
NANPASRLYAGERLEDYNAVRRGQPSLTDPILGQDTFTRAQNRLEMQRRLEQGIPGMDIAARTPDQVTALLDDAEQKSRVMVTQRTIGALERQGMSPQGAMATVDQLSRGMTWEELAKDTREFVDPTGRGLERAGAAESFGRHNLEIPNKADVEILEKLGKRMGTVGNLLAFGLAINDIENGKDVGETVAKTAGGLGGGWAGGMGMGLAGGSLVGPEGALVGGILGSIIGGIVGEEGTNAIYKWATG